jgi:hypothetical protein
VSGIAADRDLDCLAYEGGNAGAPRTTAGTAADRRTGWFFTKPFSSPG